MKTSKNEIVKDGLGFAFMVETVTDFKNGSFEVVYRTWSTELECGGYQTTLIVKGVPVTAYKFFVVAHKFELKHFEELLSAKVTKFKTNNIVSDKFSFTNMKKQLSK